VQVRLAAAARPEMEADAGKLFIGGISWDTNEDRLREYFDKYGEVVEAVIMRDRATGRARGFGFIVFADPAVAEQVILEKHMIDGRMVSKKKLFFWMLCSCCDARSMPLDNIHSYLILVAAVVNNSVCSDLFFFCVCVRWRRRKLSPGMISMLSVRAVVVLMDHRGLAAQRRYSLVVWLPP
jgi:hypothetical protein